MEFDVVDYAYVEIVIPETKLFGNSTDRHQFCKRRGKYKR